MKPRRFECTSGTSNKFWEVRNLGREHEVTFGVRGTAGQSRTKNHGSRVACATAIRKLIQSKLAKGYKEIEVNGAIGGMTKKELLDRIEDGFGSRVTFEARGDSSLLTLDLVTGKVVSIDGEDYELGKPIPTMDQAKAKAKEQRQAVRDRRTVNEKLKRLAANVSSATTAELEAIRKLTQQVERKLETEAMRSIAGKSVAEWAETYNTTTGKAPGTTVPTKPPTPEQKAKRLTFRRRGPSLG